MPLGDGRGGGGAAPYLLGEVASLFRTEIAGHHIYNCFCVVLVWPCSGDFWRSDYESWNHLK